ncbi:hypothetical protein PBRA_006670 [Plasmodiophora brassicae]|uniref:TOG domain-containing protein n=1 Tax=Plasmodiophora brassicae TaxID=37360 RepID=A0A0G4ITU3_PLABS|nr:hypothetical protein PBRA_006670 [Plasmodiophora brassicae]
MSVQNLDPNPMMDARDKSPSRTFLSRFASLSTGVLSVSADRNPLTEITEPVPLRSWSLRSRLSPDRSHDDDDEQRPFNARIFGRNFADSSDHVRSTFLSFSSLDDSTSDTDSPSSDGAAKGATSNEAEDSISFGVKAFSTPTMFGSHDSSTPPVDDSTVRQTDSLDVPQSEALANLEEDMPITGNETLRVPLAGPVETPIVSEGPSVPVSRGNENDDQAISSDLDSEIQTTSLPRHDGRDDLFTAEYRLSEAERGTTAMAAVSNPTFEGIPGSDTVQSAPTGSFDAAVHVDESGERGQQSLPNEPLPTGAAWQKTPPRNDDRASFHGTPKALEFVIPSGAEPSRESQDEQNGVEEGLPSGNAIDRLGSEPQLDRTPPRGHGGTPVEGTPKSLRFGSRRDETPSGSRRGRAIDQVNSEVPELTAVLATKHAPWQDRMDALKRIQKFTTWQIAPAALSEALEPLIDGLGVQLTDLRSQIVKQACETIADLAQALGFHFEVFADGLIGKLCDLLRIAKKVMSSSGDVCLQRIVTYAHVGSITTLISGMTTNKSPIVRCRCVEYVTLALQKWDSLHLGLYQSSIAELFDKVLADSTKDVRSAGKRLFHQYARAWPADANRVFGLLALKIQKQIVLEYPEFAHWVVHPEPTGAEGEPCLSGSADNGSAQPNEGALHEEKRMSLSSWKSEMKRRAMQQASDDAVVSEQTSSAVFTSGRDMPGSVMAAEDAAPDSPTPGSMPTSRSLSPVDRRAVVITDSPAMSPIPADFLEHPLRRGITLSTTSVRQYDSRPEPESRPTACATPLIKHSSLRFTSRVAGTPINGRVADLEDSETDVSFSTSSVQLHNMSVGDIANTSVASSVPAASEDVLARGSPGDLVSNDSSSDTRTQTKYDNLKSQLRDLSESIRAMHAVASPASVVSRSEGKTSDGSSRLPTVIINDHLTSESPEQRDAITSCSNSMVEGPGADRIVLSPKDVIHAIVTSPVRLDLPQLPVDESNPIHPSEPQPAPVVEEEPEPSSGGSGSLIGVISFAFLVLFLALSLFSSGGRVAVVPDRVPPAADDLTTAAYPARVLHYQFPPNPSPLPVVPEGDAPAAVVAPSDSTSLPAEPPAETVDDAASRVQSVPFLQGDVEPELVPSKDILQDVVIDVVTPPELAASDVAVVVDIGAPLPDESHPVADGDNKGDSAAVAEDSVPVDESIEAVTVPVIGGTYTIVSGLACWLVYTLKSVRSGPADIDIDIGGMTVAPEFELDLDAVAPRAPSARAGNGEFGTFNLVREDGTVQTVFSPMRRSLRIQRRAQKF